MRIPSISTVVPELGQCGLLDARDRPNVVRQTASGGAEASAASRTAKAASDSLSPVRCHGQPFVMSGPASRSSSRRSAANSGSDVLARVRRQDQRSSPGTPPRRPGSVRSAWPKRLAAAGAWPEPRRSGAGTAAYPSAARARCCAMKGRSGRRIDPDMPRDAGRATGGVGDEPLRTGPRGCGRVDMLLPAGEFGPVKPGRDLARSARTALRGSRAIRDPSPIRWR